MFYVIYKPSIEYQDRSYFCMMSLLFWYAIGVLGRQPRSDTRCAAPAKRPQMRRRAIASRRSFPGELESARTTVRTALCVEVRHPNRANGPQQEFGGAQSSVLYVFMPPVEALEDYLALLTAVEETASELDFSLVIEGYPPPRDPQTCRCCRSPRIPASSKSTSTHRRTGANFIDHTEFLRGGAPDAPEHREVHDRRSPHRNGRRESFLVMGAATPADSPFLRRPDVLVSLLTAQPSLDVLSFPDCSSARPVSHRAWTRQRSDLRELEIALREIERQMSQPGVPAGMVDRALRNILIDVTWYYAPRRPVSTSCTHPMGRPGVWGCLSCGGFEMLPHPRMVSAAIADSRTGGVVLEDAVSARPKTRLTRWGTQLHDGSCCRRS